MEAFSFSAPRFTEEDDERELAEMTEKERVEVQDDIYGTYEIPQETDQLRQEQLAEMERILRDSVSNEDKEAYLEACRVCPELVQTEAAPLRFLRSESYNPELAARRLVKYWEARRSIFKGQAFLPMMLADGGALSEEDEKALNWGHTMILPDDKHGRLVLCHDRSCFHLKEMSHPSVIRSVWYLVHVAIDMNEDYCRKGLVVVVPSQNTTPQHFSRKHIKLMWYSFRECFPIKTRAVHACHPTIVTDLVFPVIKHVMGRPLRRRWIRHCGSKEEVLTKLTEFGLQRESLPQALGGNWVKNPAWIEERRELEGKRHTQEAAPMEH